MHCMHALLCLAGTELVVQMLASMLRTGAGEPVRFCRACDARVRCTGCQGVVRSGQGPPEFDTMHSSLEWHAVHTPVAMGAQRTPLWPRVHSARPVATGAQRSRSHADSAAHLHAGDQCMHGD
jgi:hypothetical protein